MSRTKRTHFLQPTRKAVNEPERVEPAPVKPVQRFERGRLCSVCEIPLCSYNPGAKCWLHGGWEDHEFGELVRALLELAPMETLGGPAA